MSTRRKGRYSLQTFGCPVFLNTKRKMQNSKPVLSFLSWAIMENMIFKSLFLSDNLSTELSKTKFSWGLGATEMEQSMSGCGSPSMQGPLAGYLARPGHLFKPGAGIL